MKKKSPEKSKWKDKFGRLPPQWSFPLWYLPLMLLLLWMWQGAFSQFAVRTIPYSEFKQYLGRNEVTEAAVKEEEITGTIKPKAEVAPAETPKEAAKASETKPTKPFLFRTIRVEDPKLVEQMEQAGVKFTGIRPSFLSQILVAWVLPIGLMILLWSWIGRKIGGAGQSMLSIGKSKARLVADKDTKVTFDDVAGCEEAKFELQEVVDFLKNPQRYKSIGAKIPKGVLLV